MLIRVYDVTYVKTQFNHSNGYWTEMVKITIKLFKRLFFQKINENIQSKTVMKYFVHSRE